MQASKCVGKGFQVLQWWQLVIKAKRQDIQLGRIYHPPPLTCFHQKDVEMQRKKMAMSKFWMSVLLQKKREACLVSGTFLLVEDLWSPFHVFLWMCVSRLCSKLTWWKHLWLRQTPFPWNIIPNKYTSPPTHQPGMEIGITLVNGSLEAFYIHLKKRGRKTGRKSILQCHSFSHYPMV